jgi:hypothetical protein
MVTIRGGVVDGEMIVQLEDWVDEPLLCSAINIFTIPGALSAGDSKDSDWEVMVVRRGANI